MTPEPLAATAPVADLKWALDALKANVSRYALPRAYYDGNHEAGFASDKLKSAFGFLFRRYAENYCPVVVETLADRLVVAGFTVISDAAAGQDDATAAARDAAVAKVEQYTRDVWRRNRMSVRAGEVHTDACCDGDAYVIVWPDAAGFPVFYPNRAHQIAISYDDEQPGYITRAAKLWPMDDGRYRLTLYYRDRIEKYVTERKGEGGFQTEPRNYTRYEVEGERWPLPNPYDKVPVFHFPNRGKIGQLGRSELAEVISPQQGLNKTVIDLLVGMEFHAVPQRWATGLKADSDEEIKKGTETQTQVGKLRAGGLWAVDTAETRFGDFATADLEKFNATSERFCKTIARVSRTPVYYLTQEGAMPSGEAMKTAEAPLTTKVHKRQEAWGGVWADVMRFACRIGASVEPDLDTVWADTAPRNEKDQVEIALSKQEAGVPRDQTLREIGYEAAEVEAFKEERAAVDIIPEVDQ